MKNFQETVFGDKNVNLLAAEPHITSLPLPAANYDAIMRQLKSTSRDLRRMFTADLTVLQIAERFSTIDANASTSEAIDLMHQRDLMFTASGRANALSALSRKMPLIIAHEKQLQDRKS